MSLALPPARILIVNVWLLLSAGIAFEMAFGSWVVACVYWVVLATAGDAVAYGFCAAFNRKPVSWAGYTLFAHTAPPDGSSFWSLLLQYTFSQGVFMGLAGAELVSGPIWTRTLGNVAAAVGGVGVAVLLLTLFTWWQRRPRPG